MKNITVCPSLLTQGFHDYSPKAIKTLFSGNKTSCMLDFRLDDKEIRDSKSVINLSISGAQEKYPALLDGGKIRLARPEERSTFILKPAPIDRIYLRKVIPANEHLTMQIASQVYGIETALNGLCFDSSGQTIYITKRFDIEPDGKKIDMEDFASLVGKSTNNGGPEYKYNASYEEIALAIRKNIPAKAVILEKFLRLVVFNYLIGNGDAHLKNFSIIRRNGDVTLAPAYDLINTALHIKGDDFALKDGLSPNIEPSDQYVATGHPCKLDFERFGQLIGISEKRIAHILDPFMNFPTKVDELIAHSFLPDEKTKRTYRSIIEERRKRFIRKSL